MHASRRAPCGNTMQHARAASGEPQPDASADDVKGRRDDRLRECALDSRSYASPVSTLQGPPVVFVATWGQQRYVINFWLTLLLKVAYLNIKWTNRKQSVHITLIIFSLLVPFLVSTTFRLEVSFRHVGTDGGDEWRPQAIFTHKAIKGGTLLTGEKPGGGNTGTLLLCPTGPECSTILI